MSSVHFYRFAEEFDDDIWLLDLAKDPNQHNLSIDLTAGKKLDYHDPVRLRNVGKGNRQVDIAFTVLGIPVLSERAGKVFQVVAPRDTQCLKAEIDGVAGPFYALNIAKRLDCLDEQRTVFGDIPGFTLFRPVLEPVIDPAKVAKETVFRLHASPVHIIVNDQVKVAVEAAQLTGAVMQPVETTLQ